MRGQRGEVDRVRTDPVRRVVVGGACGVRRARFAALVGSVLACAVGAWGLGSIGAVSAFAGTCPNEAARQGPSVELPECRAYEQVTPVDKGDALDIFGSTSKPEEGVVVDLGNEAYVAEEGGAILVQTHGSFAPDATAISSGYVFSRGAGGWRMSVLAQSIDEPQEVEEERDLFDAGDLSEVAFLDKVGTTDDLSAFQQTGLVGPSGGPYAPLFSISGFHPIEGRKQIEMVGGSEDLSHVVLEGEDHSLAAGAEAQDPGTDALYETTGGGECGPATSNCTLVDVDGEGRAMPCGATLGQGELGSGGAHTAVSSDGSRVFFTAPQPEDVPAGGAGCWNSGVSPQENPPEVYVREGGTRTVEVSKPEEGIKVAPENPGNPLLPAVFVGASADGSKVFFMTKTELTSNAAGHTPELYEYNFEPHGDEKPLTLISGVKSGGVEGDVDNVTAISSDGSTVYFSAYGELAEHAQAYSPGTEEFSPVNLYRYDTITGETTFVATLNKYDYPVSFGQGYSWYTEEFGRLGAEQEGLTYEKEWYTTGDGRFLVFGTVLPLTGFDNIHAPGARCPNNYAGGGDPERCLELYRYDAATGGIVCVSCAGGAPVDGAYFARAHFNSPASGPPRPISEDGEDVFFESANALVPQATPGREHVYEWHDGVVSLISSPSDPGNAIFLGSSANGEDVFFVTHAQLVAEDTDQSADVYDARVDGGFAGVTPSQCTGTGCQGVPAAPPVFATPASVTFEGVGNFPSASEVLSSSEGLVRVGSKPKPVVCKRGFVKKRGVCVRKRAGKKAKRSARGRK